MRLQRQSNGQLITIDPALALGTGGEARVYATPQEPLLVAKIYHEPTSDRARKREDLLQATERELTAIARRVETGTLHGEAQIGLAVGIAVAVGAVALPVLRVGSTCNQLRMELAAADAEVLKTAVHFDKEVAGFDSRERGMVPKALDALCDVQEPAWRHGVGPNRVYSTSRHRGEVALDRSSRAVLLALRIGTKRSVRHPADVEFLPSDKEEFSLDIRPHDCSKRVRYPSDPSTVVCEELPTHSMR